MIKIPFEKFHAHILWKFGEKSQLSEMLHFCNNLQRRRLSNRAKRRGVNEDLVGRLKFPAFI